MKNEVDAESKEEDNPPRVSVHAVFSFAPSAMPSLACAEILTHGELVRVNYSTAMPHLWLVLAVVEYLVSWYCVVRTVQNP